MTRLHDMGGRFGDGPVVRDAPDAPVFAKPWHARALAVTLACGALGQWTLDTSRHARERLSPRDYARFSYYEKWLAALTDLLVETGVITPEELRGTVTPAPSPLSNRALRAEAVPATLARGGPTLRPDAHAAPARFAPGDRVRSRRPARNTQTPGGHTRLPAYAAGARGRVVLCHGSHVFPDTNAHGQGECPQPLYAVAFSATELWGRAENPGDEVILDLWDSYLEPDT